MRLAVVATLTALLLGAAPAYAQSSEAAKKKAQALYDEAMVALEESRYDTACPKFAEAAELVPEGIGVKLMLGECLERWGKLAASYQVYRRAEIEAGMAKQTERQAKAAARVKAIGERVGMLTIVVAPSFSAEDLVVTLDGSPVAGSGLGSPMPVEPGTRVVRASSKSGTFERSVSIVARGDVTVRIEPGSPSAGPVVAEPAGSATEPVPFDRPASQPEPDTYPYRTAGFVVGGVGVATAAVGAGLLIKAMLDQEDADEVCPARECSDRDAVDLSNGAATLNVAGLVLTGIGAAATVTGVVLIALPGPSPAEAATLVIGPRRMTLTVPF